MTETQWWVIIGIIATAGIAYAGVFITMAVLARRAWKEGEREHDEFKQRVRSEINAGARLTKRNGA
jgi:hypothetical protein